MISAPKGHTAVDDLLFVLVGRTVNRRSHGQPSSRVLQDRGSIILHIQDQYGD